jgi:hypothetical protein
MPKDTKKVFSEKMLKGTEVEEFQFVKTRISELKETRQDVYGTNIDIVWANADRDYVPHRLNTKGKKVVATDEDKGWRGALVNLGTTDWQSDISQPNPFVKIQVALSILVDQNPTGVFTPTSKKYVKTTELMKQLYKRSWEYANSVQQLKLFVFNLAKYGWAVARTYPLRIARKTKVLMEYNQEDPSKSVYEEKEVTEFNDIMRENLDPRNVWIDDMAKPNNKFSIRDWAWRKVYSMDAAEEEFGMWPNWKYVQQGGVTTEVTDQSPSDVTKRYKDTRLVEVYFYENRLKDLFWVIINGVPVVMSPLPISDGNGNKKLSLWQTYWNLRHAECPYGIGIYEAIQFDQALLDRIRNMTIDQLTLSIYKMFFYQGTSSLAETGDIKIAPGAGKQVLDPKNISWLQVPGPGAEAWQGLQQFRADLDEDSGIGDPLLGNVTGKTAFEIAQSKEAALKRLKNPLQNVIEALEQEAYITISLIQLMYSIPEVYTITEGPIIEAYLKETQGDPELWDRNEEGQFQAKVFKEFPLTIEQDATGKLIESKEEQFFRVKPSALQWEGIIKVQGQSILTPSKQVDKAQDLEMYNLILPMLSQPPELYQKAVSEIIKLYDKEPKDILPEAWLNPAPEQPEEKLILGPNENTPGQAGKTPPDNTAMGVVQAPQPGQDINAPRVVSQIEPPSMNAGVAQASEMNSAPF